MYTIENIDDMSLEEKQSLLARAKDAYYNSSEELLTDELYDYLEASLGLENESYIGSKQGNYTERHSFIMGSISKVQVKAPKDGEPDWEAYANALCGYIEHSDSPRWFEFTPKLDGCSFSAEFMNRGGKMELLTVATRGNGTFGSDIKHWFIPQLNKPQWSKIASAVTSLCIPDTTDRLVIRGEVLVQEKVFRDKYSEDYVNPRAFVAGMLGLKPDDASIEKLQQGEDLHFVCYDYRLVRDGKYKELSFMNNMDETYGILAPYLGGIGETPDKRYCVCLPFENLPSSTFKNIYKFYENYRNNLSEYALDGIVVKANCTSRLYNEDRPRPLDCVAIKFMPMVMETKIVDIDWKVKKTGEYFPTAILESVVMPDGKTVSKASLHNYNNVIRNVIGIGSKVKISLAGDIIPYIIEVVDGCPTDNNINLPEDGMAITEDSGTLHYMKQFSEEEEMKNKFLSSCYVLNINTIGPANASLLYETMKDTMERLDNVIYLMNDGAYETIKERLGDGKSTINIIDNMRKFAKQITITDIIKSFCFKSCGEKASIVCARLLSGLQASTASLPSVAYSWALDGTPSREKHLVLTAMDMLGVDPLVDAQPTDQTPVILTGSPSAFGFKTKGEFMSQHPEFRETTSWKEAKMLITDDLGSNSSKMQKAKKAGIAIKTYGDCVQ